ncbi:ParB/RepB/Spo0J family partition protein [Vibrio fluvialis]|nr:ParB/RepB/Spo0J family partition protein [Vibrio fluvialis]EMA2482786.1 ParB/RepB/Spo0J family partition protein [Vibrio fluvialis]
MMTIKKQGFLSKSLASVQHEQQATLPQIVPVGFDLVQLECDLIDYDPEQPRKDWPVNKLDELKDSIEATNGCIVPIKVRPNPANVGRYLLVYGEGRLRNHRALEYPTILTLVPVGEMDTKTIRVEQTIENVVRANMTRLEEANAYLNLMNEYELSRQQLKKIVGASDAKITRLFKLAASSHKVKELDGYTTSYNLLSSMADLEQLISPESFDKICTRVKDKDINEKEVQALVTKERKACEKYGFYNHHNLYQKALFEALDRHNRAFEFGEAEKDEAAEKLEDAVQRVCEERDTKPPYVLDLMVIHITEEQPLGMFLNRNSIRIFLDGLVARQQKEDSISPFYKAVAVVANGELDEDELEEAEDTLKRVCYEHGIQDPQELVTKDWTPENLTQEPLMNVLAQELQAKKAKQKNNDDSATANRQVVIVSDFEFEKDGSLVLTNDNGKIVVMVSKKLVQQIAKGTKK